MGGIAVSDDLNLPSTSGSSWGLSRDIAGDAQGLVTSGFGKLPAACALILSAGKTGGAWLAELEKVAPVTASNGRTTPSIALAFTSLGLKQIGITKEVLNDFALPFVEGMMQEDRRRRLGDVDEKGLSRAPIEWGLPATKETANPIHALLIVYHKTHNDLIKLVDGTIVPALKGADVAIVRHLALDLSVGETDDVREHFGFVDGVSQPIPYGPGTDDGTGKEVAKDPIHGVPLGEILLGHPDAHATASTGPFIVGTAGPNDTFVPSRALPAEAAVEAMRNPGGQKLHDLGLNGAYLVVRELRQDVDAFWAAMAKAAAGLDTTPPVTKEWVAERVVGRSLDGHMLRPGGTTLPPLPPVAPATQSVPDNDFLYFTKDRHGYGCPLGSHVRRANPRDGLAYAPFVCEDLLRSANAHRILRRGRKFGPDIGGADSTSGKGLLFICLNGDIARQFEFVQQNWMLNPNFATLHDEVDPLVGPKGQMTLPGEPLRRRVGVDTFITLVGGDYFFLPSISTLRILAALPEAEQTGPVS